MRVRENKDPLRQSILYQDKIMQLITFYLVIGKFNFCNDRPTIKRTSTSFLALLDFVSRATVMAQASVVRRPSSVRKLKFLRNRCLDPDQILWEATYPPSLQTFLFFFQNFQFSNFYDFFFVFVNMGPYGSTNFKTLLLLQFSSDLSQTLS